MTAGSIETAERPRVTLAELLDAIDLQRHQQAPGPAATAVPEPLEVADRSCCVVVGAHTGAGASTVAVAIADALAQHDGNLHVRLVDGAPSDTSGLLCAAGHELGTLESGWRSGRREAVEVFRPAHTVASPDALPGLTAVGDGRLVVDAGWPVRDLLARPNLVGSLLSSSKRVVVCRATVPGVRRAELALRALPRPLDVEPVVVVVGARHLPGEVKASFGPLLRDAAEDHRLAHFPTDRRLEVSGVDARALPRPLVAAAMSLLDLIWTDSRTAHTKRVHRSKGRA